MTKRLRIITGVLFVLIGILVADPMNSPVHGQGCFSSWFCERSSLNSCDFGAFGYNIEDPPSWVTTYYEGTCGTPPGCDRIRVEIFGYCNFYYGSAQGYICCTS
jgi:hypothetical protein